MIRILDWTEVDVAFERRVQRLEERVTILESDRDNHADKIDHVLKVVVDMHNDFRRFQDRLPDLIAGAIADSQKAIRGQMDRRFAEAQQEARRRFEQLDQRFEQVDQRFEQTEKNHRDLRQELVEKLDRALAGKATKRDEGNS